jgi:hypothetical protein
MQSESFGPRHVANAADQLSGCYVIDGDYRIIGAADKKTHSIGREDHASRARAGREVIDDMVVCIENSDGAALLVRHEDKTGAFG